MPHAKNSSFACHPSAAGVARHWAADVLDQQTGDQARELITLLISELVTNALRHCASTIDLVVQVVGDNVRVEVWDEAGDQSPTMRDVQSGDEHGRGLHLVDSVASGWGVVRAGAKKAVWFEVASGLPRARRTPA